VFSSWWLLISFNSNPLFLCSQSLKNPNLRKILCSWLLDSRYILIDFYVLTGYSTFMLQFTRRKFAIYRNKSPSSIPSWQALRCQWEADDSESENDKRWEKKREQGTGTDSRREICRRFCR
jgi:hypothetical protein